MKIIIMKGLEDWLELQRDSPSLFDSVRKKKVAATPEEKVRQFIIQYLVQQRKYPRALLGVEVSLQVNRLQKRCDILAYKNNMPVMIVECKSPSVKIDQSVFDQAARYNLALHVPYLMITNGLLSLCSRVDWQKGTFEFMEDVPEYGDLV